MTNTLMENKWPWVEGMIGMREGLLEPLTDADLAFNPGGKNLTLGALLVQMGEIQHAYTESLKTFDTDFDFRSTEAGLAGDLTRLKAWYARMDADFKTRLESLSEADLQKPIKRPSGSTLPIELQIDIYVQALFIVYGKLMVYLRAMNKTLGPAVEEYIG